MRTQLIKRVLVIAAVMLLMITSGTSRAAGPAFRELQSIKLPFTPSTHWYSHTGDFNYFLCSNKSDMLMFDGVTGNILWQKNFEKDFSNKKFKNQFWNKDANVILVYDEDTKKSVATKYFIDGKTGKLLWSSDKYVSDFGKYELSEGFSDYYDYNTNSVLLPTKESVDLVEVNTGKTLWSKSYTLSGKAKEFDCYIMKYYDLVKIISGKESETYLTTGDGTEVSDIELYFNKKKFMGDRLHAMIIDIPEKSMYVLIQGETNKLIQFLGGGTIPKRKMTFKGYDAKTNELLWNKKYTIAYQFDWIDKTPFIRAYYDNGRIMVEHDAGMSDHSGLTVINPDNGEQMWEARFTTAETKFGLKKSTMTPFPAPSPVTVNDKTYVVNKDKNIVSCYDAVSGMKIWDSGRFPDAQKIPTFFASDELLIMGHGGDAIKCVSISQSQGPPVNIHEYNSKDKYGIIAYDAQTGKEIWSDNTIKKAAKDNFGFIAGMELIDGKLFCATDKNFFILDPKTGNVMSSIPVSKEKLGNTWKMFYFEDEQKIILNCAKGIVKINPVNSKIEAVVKTPTIPFYSASLAMNADDLYKDYAVYSTGNVKKGKFKKFAAIDLDKMTVRGTENCSLLLSGVDHFSEGAEMFFKVDKSAVKIFSVK